MKKLRKLSALLIAILMIAALLCGCTNVGKPATSPIPSGAPVTSKPAESPASKIAITDMMGRTATLDAPATKVVALTASDCEILYALGAGDTLVGRGEYCDYPEEVKAVPAVQSGNTTNIEQIIALGPQVVLMNTMAQTEEQVKTLEGVGIKVIVNNAVNIEGVYESIGIIGSAVGKDAEAGAVIENMKKAFADLTAKAKGNGSRSVYFEVSPRAYGLWTAGSGTFMDEIATMLGLKNAFGDVTGWGEISEDEVIRRDPGYIVTIAMYAGQGETPVEEIKGRDGWQNMKAVKNNTVFNAGSDELARPIPRLADGAKSLYDFVYGTASN